MTSIIHIATSYTALILFLFAHPVSSNSPFFRIESVVPHDRKDSSHADGFAAIQLAVVKDTATQPVEVKDTSAPMKNAEVMDTALPEMHVNATGGRSERPAPEPLTWRAALGAASVTMCIVFALYWHKGLFVVVNIIIYLFALSTMKGVVKMVEHNNSFKYPLFLTATHFAAGAVIAFGLLFRRSLKGEPLTIPSLESFATRFGPIAAAFALSIAMGNMALVHATTAFVEIVSASGPLVTVALMIFMRQPVALELLGPCFLVFFGCAMTSNGEPSFSMIGLALAAGANVPRSVKTILQQRLLSNDVAVFAPLEVLAWMCLPSCFVMLAWSLLQEGTAPIIQLYQQGFSSSLTGVLLLSCVNACILNLAVLFVVKDLGAIGTQIVAQAKSILVVLGGVCFLHEQVSKMEFVGFIMVLIGVYTFNDVDARLKAQKKAEQGHEDEKQPLHKDMK